MADVDDFDSVRDDNDPLRRARRAAALQTHYTQRATELSRLRKAAIEEAHRDLNLSYTEIAKALGISKGRITQIRGSAPAQERAFFGVGPVAVGVPLRHGTDHRMRTYVDAADLTARAQAESILVGLSLAAEPFNIEPDLETPPAGDSIIICGPRSAPVAANLLSQDVHLGFTREDERWRIDDHESGAMYFSPRLANPPQDEEFGYFARHRDEDRVVVHVAGITAVGSSGVLHYLETNVRELFSSQGDTSFSLIVKCTFDSDTAITGSELVAGPYSW
ncbi:hypothetical protein [Amycolatopsis sp. FDAARGOS 1241]|uniref:hypothetical protein n=1 Tax=Amycolatopsis sp. FDAARGOS 1241 TaxID=2778070 RepID=UPI00194EF024|nr:hypothetical protein [Amycolatopsis sp. FDAARGOS 1241]QRP45783.1 hypothetical protein I6J71_43000 [Amycolatopsis sp. FDAARGOS 1241]